MYASDKFGVFIVLLMIFYKLNILKAEENVKIWKPNNDIYSKENWVDPNAPGGCATVEFGKINSADILISKLTAKQFILPITGQLVLLDGGYLEVVGENSKKKTDCMKLKEMEIHKFLNPQNWKSDASENLAVPDTEKIPCSYDAVKFPNGLNSAVYTTGAETVSVLEFGNLTFDSYGFSRFKESDLGHSVFDNSDSQRNDLRISRRVGCFDPSGCSCNRQHSVHCPPRKKVECLGPVDPWGFCHRICGAFITLTPKRGFSIQKIAKALEAYSDVYTHVSKVWENIIQIVFAEEKYTGDSVVYARKFHDHLMKEMDEYKISVITELAVSGATTSGDSYLFVVFVLSLLFVAGLFGTIFYVYGDYKIPFGIRLTSPSISMTSTYRARFSSREDESGLIFDNQSLAGSVMNLDQSFDNPLYGQVSTGPHIDEDVEAVEAERHLPKLQNTQSENHQGDILYDLTKLNLDLKEEMSSESVEEIPSIIKLENAPITSGNVPLLQLEEEDDDTE